MSFHANCERRARRSTLCEAYETVVPKSSRTRLHAALKNPNAPARGYYLHEFVDGQEFCRFTRLAWEGKRSRTREGTTLASIGPVTSATLRALGLGVDVEAKQFTIPGLVKAIAGSRR